MTQADKGHRATVDEADVARFEALGDDWWAERGSMAPLHRLNPVRIAYIRDHICQHFGDSAGCPRDPRTPSPLAGLTLLDKGHLGDLGTSHLVALNEIANWD